jgi:hypothetical protein
MIHGDIEEIIKHIQMGSFERAGNYDSKQRVLKSQITGTVLAFSRLFDR